MGQVTVTLNGRTYRLTCGAGEEPRLLQLAEHVKERIDALADEFGHAGDDRLLLMAALLVTDELFDARDRLMALAMAAQPEQQGAVAMAAPSQQPMPVDLPPQLPMSEPSLAGQPVGQARPPHAIGPGQGGMADRRVPRPPPPGQRMDRVAPVPRPVKSAGDPRPDQRSRDT